MARALSDQLTHLCYPLDDAIRFGEAGKPLEDEFKWLLTLI